MIPKTVSPDRSRCSHRFLKLCLTVRFAWKKSTFMLHLIRGYLIDPTVQEVNHTLCMPGYAFIMCHDDKGFAPLM